MQTIDETPDHGTPAATLAHSPHMHTHLEAVRPVAGRWQPPECAIRHLARTEIVDDDLSADDRGFLGAQEKLVEAEGKTFLKVGRPSKKFAITKAAYSTGVTAHSRTTARNVGDLAASRLTA